MPLAPHTVKVLEIGLANEDAAHDIASMIGVGGGVTSFNTRTGAVTLTSTDVTNALGDANIAYTDVANTFTLGQTIDTGADGNVGLTIQANSGSQSADLQRWQSSTPSTLAKITALGAGSFLTASATGLTGATAASRYVGATASGAPAAGTFAVGDFIVDQGGTIRVCTTAGSPGTWQNVGGVTSFNTRTGAVTLLSSDVNSAFADPNATALSVSVTDAATTTVTNLLTLDHDSSGTPAAGFGGSLVMRLDSATVADRSAAEWDWLWATATDVSRKARTIGYVYDNTAAREWIRAESDGTVGLAAFGGTILSSTRLAIYPGGDAYKGVVTVMNTASQSANLAEWQNATNAVISLVGPTGQPTWGLIDAGTNSVATVETLRHNTTGTAAAGFGGSQLLQLDSTTTANRSAAEWDWLWATATDASRKARIIGYVYDNTAAREWIRAESDGTLPILGICGAVKTSTMLTVNPGNDAYKGLVVPMNSATQSADLTEWQDASSNVISFIGPTGQPTWGLRDATTNAVGTVVTTRHNSTGTPAAGFGGGALFQLDSTTTANRSAAEWDWLWATATDASRKARTIGYVYDNTAAREWIRAESDGSQSIAAVGGAVIASVGLTVRPGQDSYVPLVVIGNSGTQSGDLLQSQTSGGAVRARINSSGEFTNPLGAATNETFGAGAMPSTITGAQNTVFGNGAGHALSSGTTSTFIGYQSGKAATNNTAMVGVGSNSLALANGGASCTGIGNGALNTMTSASNNTAVGNSALGSITGSNNTALGASTGGNVGSGTNCVILGVSADAVSSNLSNVIALGGSAKGQANEFALAPTCNFQTFYVTSSTSTLRQRSDFTVSNIDNTDATRKYRIVFNVWDTAAREYMRADADGTLAVMGMGGAVVASTKLIIYQGSDAYIGQVIKANSASASGDLIEFQDSSANVLSFVAATGAGTFGLRNATTAAIDTVFTIRHNSTGTPAANFGSGLVFRLDSTTTANRAAGEIDTFWATATDASRAAVITFNAYDTAQREGFRIQASGTVAQIGFFGASAVSKQNTTGTTAGYTDSGATVVHTAGTFTGNTGATAYTIGDIVLALKNYGLLAA